MRLSNSLLILAGTALFSSPVYTQSQPSDLEAAKEALKSGHANQDLVLADRIVAKAMLEDAKDPAAVCPGEAVAVLQNFMKGEFTVSVENDWCEAMLVKGYALNELKRPVEAAEILKILVGHTPNNAQYLIEYAYTVRVNGENERAFDLYKRAEKRAAEFPNRASEKHWQAAALRGQGYIYIESKRWDDAAKAYKKSLKYEPENEIAGNELRYIEDHKPR